MAASRAAILHLDDLGMCHGANQAFLELAAAGQVTCGSVMTPCPWLRQIADAALADPTLDLGVHLTLTSEWSQYRWSPLSTRSPASGLIDPDGYFWPDLRSLAAHLVIDAVEEELRAQIERAVAAGLRPTHIDAHMAAAMLPELLNLHVQLARDYDLFPILPRRLSFAPDPERYEATVAFLDRLNLPVVDHIRGTLPVAGDRVEAEYRELIATLPPGITHLALHCTTPGEIEAISPQHAPWRVNEYRLFQTGAVTRWCEEDGIAVIGTRQLQAEWSRACASAA